MLSVAVVLALLAVVVLAVALVSMVLPFFIGLAVPRLTGEQLSSDSDLVQALGAGPKLEHAPGFPDRTNVEFARLEGGEIEVVVWERGAGLTSRS